ncbi:g3512 [Coccomyxa viridis]|uniref:Adenylate kinase isoenzyme 6 homolog n=1 Tax=Coccomyxa viridis TaxID=1274662 RepID=A0ABP1FV41_9CHLO
MAKQRPNVLVTGSPGTGKSTTCEQIAEATGLTYVDIGSMVKSQELHSGWDDEYSCYIIDEDKVCDALEDQLNVGGNIVDFHSCDFFPERWFDLVIVLQTDNTILYDRLEKRGYGQKKLTENVECEIMQVILQEAFDSYREEIVQVLPSNTVEDMESNVERTVAWYKQVLGQLR